MFGSEDFGKINHGVNPGGEMWGENEHGCFSLISGQFIENGKKGDMYASFKPEVTIMFPCEDGEDE